MGSTHQHSPHHYDRSFAIGVALNAGFVLVELVYGVLSDSLALIADAGHNLSDVLSLLLAWGASRLARRAPSVRFTYGFGKATVLAALLSAAVLLVALGGIAWEAIGRLRQPTAVQSVTVLVVAAIGVVINTATAFLFHRDRERDLNIRGAYLHMAADAAVSLGVVIGSIVIMTTGWLWVDPALSLLIAAVILVGTWGLLRDSLRLSLDAVPREIDPGAVDAWLRTRPGVGAVHDLHIWAMSTTQTALTAHLVMPAGSADDDLRRLAEGLLAEFGIDHSTLQTERSEAACRVACDAGQRTGESG